MSYILEAIQKADQERKGEGVQGRRLAVLEPPLLQEPKRLIWPYFLAVALFVNAGLLGWWLSVHRPEEKVSSGLEQQTQIEKKEIAQQSRLAVEQPIPPSTVQEPRSDEIPAAAVKSGRTSEPAVTLPQVVVSPPVPPPVAEPLPREVVSPAEVALPAAEKPAPVVLQKPAAVPPLAPAGPPSPVSGPQPQGKPAVVRPTDPAASSPTPAPKIVSGPVPPPVQEIEKKQEEIAETGGEGEAEPAAEKAAIASGGAPAVSLPSLPVVPDQEMAPSEAAPDTRAVAVDDAGSEELEGEEAGQPDGAGVVDDEMASAGNDSGLLQPEADGDQVVTEEDMVQELERESEKEKEEKELARIPFLHQLPDTVQQSIPEIHISFHAYSRKASSRLVSINGKIVREGQDAVKGLTLEKITSKGVVFLFQSRRFKLDI